MSYSKIAKILMRRAGTVHYAMKCYAERGELVDRRTLNEWKNNPNRKITQELAQKMLDRKLL